MKVTNMDTKRGVFFTLIAILLPLTMADDRTWVRNCLPEDDTTGTSTCFYFHDNVVSVTWSEARDRCKEMNQSLAMIQNKTAESAIQTLISSNLVRGSQIWLSGKRSDDTEWRYLYAKEYLLRLHGSVPSERYCGMYQIGRGHTMSDSCTQDTYHFGFCQYNTTSSPDECLEGDILYQGHCFHVTAEEYTWFEARNYCRKYHKGADLSVTLLPDHKLVDTLKDRPRTTLYLWLAVARMPWQWIDAQGSPVAMDTYRFRPHEGSKAEKSSCLFLSPDGDGALMEWMDKSCDDPSRYFVCQRDDEVVTAAPPVHPSEGDSSREEEDDDDADGEDGTTDTTPSSREGGPVAAPMSNTTKYIIIGVCVGFPVLVAVIVVSVILAKRQPPSKAEEPNKFASLSNRQITKADIYVVPDNNPEIHAGYSTISSTYNHTPASGHTMNGPYSEIPAQIHTEQTTVRESVYQNLPDLPITMTTAHSYQSVAMETTEEDFSPTSFDSVHFMADSGDIYTLPNKNVSVC